MPRLYSAASPKIKHICFSYCGLILDNFVQGFAICKAREIVCKFSRKEEEETPLGRLKPLLRH